MLLLTLLGAFGLLLTLVGIFSMTAYAVARRTREIGVRVAFGARPGQVVGVMIRDAAWPVVLGLVAVSRAPTMPRASSPAFCSRRLGTIRPPSWLSWRYSAARRALRPGYQPAGQPPWIR
jgi:hypothetical protein